MAHDLTDSGTEIGRIFAELGSIRLGETDLDGVLHRVADLARRTLPGAAQVTITMVRGGDARSAASTAEAVLRLDEQQYARGAGPSLAAAAGRSTVAVPDTAGDDGFDDDGVHLTQTFVRYAAVALANAHLYDSTASRAQHMRAAMESRAVIEQAKGIIMGERRCTAEEAFGILTKVSQDSNRKLRDVAAALVGRTQRAP
ncbi:ANTAR domain-containing protein [Actinoplanes sp. DH11]|uniref:ANTAR domain-containing protein n=1 Tax=Actinoplanes sp. DH11 TaxID=2857011 RepID=UPI001E399D8F|nr:ANTAR domain-containing protein [Actinoplanes sp. DH11]